MTKNQNNSEKYNIVIVDNHRLFLEGVVAMFKNSVVNVLGTATGQKELEFVLNQHHNITIILLDLNLEKEDGLEIIESLRKKGFRQKIIILTSYHSIRIVNKIKELKVEGFVLKDTEKDNLVDAICKVGQGGKHFDLITEDNNYLEPEIKYQDDFIKKHNLGKREYEVLILIAKSYSSKEIAEKIFITEQTVATYRKRIKAKLKLKSIADMVRFAFINDLL